MASFPGAFTGRINRPSLPRSNTFNGPPFSNPSRRHHHSGKTVWRFEVKVIVMVIIFIVRIYYLKTRFVKGFARILRVQFCSPIELTSRKFMSDSSIDMKEKSPCTAKFKANGGFSGSPLPNDYFVAGGWLAAKGSFRQREIRGQKFCRQGWRLPVSFTVAVRSNRLPGKFPPMISNHPFTRISRSWSSSSFCHCKDLLPRNAIYQGFRPDFSHAILCACCTKRSKIYVRLVN